MPLFLSHVAVKIRGLCSVYIVYGAKIITDYTDMRWSATIELNPNLPELYIILEITEEKFLNL